MTFANIAANKYVNLWSNPNILYMFQVVQDTADITGVNVSNIVARFEKVKKVWALKFFSSCVGSGYGWIL